MTALDHVAGRIDDSAYLDRLGHFRVDLATVDATTCGDLTAKRAVLWLRVLAETWTKADVPEARADLLHAIYERIVVHGRTIVAARLTPAAYSNGLALALPQVVMARPEGVERARTTSVGTRDRRGHGPVTLIVPPSSRLRAIPGIERCANEGREHKARLAPPRTTNRAAPHRHAVQAPP